MHELGPIRSIHTRMWANLNHIYSCDSHALNTPTTLTNRSRPTHPRPASLQSLYESFFYEKYWTPRVFRHWVSPPVLFLRPARPLQATDVPGEQTSPLIGGDGSSGLPVGLRVRLQGRLGHHQRRNGRRSRGPGMKQTPWRNLQGTLVSRRGS